MAPEQVLHDGYKYELLGCDNARYVNGWLKYQDSTGGQILHIHKDSGIIEIFQPHNVNISRIGRDTN